MSIIVITGYSSQLKEIKNRLRDMKEKYKLTTNDRINKTLNNISMIQSLIEVLK